MKKHGWVWYYRATTGYICLMLTLVAILLLIGSR